MSARVGVDTGGTYTDLVASDLTGAFTVSKTLSTPEPARATAEALESAGLGAPGAVDTLVHGTTIATNALLERSGARVGLITTEGFGDLLELQRGGRPNSFDLRWIRAHHLVPPQLVREVRERIGPDGGVREELDEADVRRAARELADGGVETIAVSLLFSFLNPDHERRVGEILKEEQPGIEISLSCEVFPQIREYERASTAVIDAYLKPPVDRYASELERLAEDQGVREMLVMRSNGGAITPDGVRRLPVSMVRSGPAGGVIAAAFVASTTGQRNVILADMGGTSFDVCLIKDGEPLLTAEAELEWGIPYCQPMVDVRSIGAGGGSIAWIDAAGILRVGPQSAGADPGPACYSRGGTEATVTDANLVLGRLGAALSLAGGVTLDQAKASDAIGHLAERMGLGPTEVAHGILEIADNNMAQQLRLISIDRGLDPRDFTLMAFGGAGPLHATSLARALGMRRIVVPCFPGAFSAFGALIADTRFDYLRSALITGADDVETIRALFDQLAQRAREDLARQGEDGAEAHFERRMDVRYRGQAWELEVSVSGDVTADSLADARAQFHRDHRDRFGWSLEWMPIECVNFKLAAVIDRSRPVLPALDQGPLPAPLMTRDVRFERGGEPLPTPVFWRSDLHAGNDLHGPAVIAEAISTTLLPPGDHMRVDDLGNLLINVSDDAQAAKAEPTAKPEE
jgi:N-methylhydantoinase A